MAYHKKGSEGKGFLGAAAAGLEPKVTKDMQKSLAELRAKV